MHALFLPNLLLALVELAPHLRNFLGVLCKLNFRFLDRKLSMLLLVEDIVASWRPFSFAPSNDDVLLSLDIAAALLSVDAIKKLSHYNVEVF